MSNCYKFRFIDLFAGIGGFHQAMTTLGGKCVFASEIDKECQKQYSHQFKMKVHGDINKCLDDIPEFDVLCAGFPCQTFSKAGLQEGFDDEKKGKLFFTIIKILKHHPECEFIILENVRNLADDKNFWNTIQKNLKELDFYVTKEPIILSPDNFGIPQNRERVYILGIRKSLKKNAKLKNDGILLEDLNVDKFFKKCKDNAAFEILEKDNNNNGYAITKKENDVIEAWECFKKNIIPNEKISFPIWLDYFGISQSDKKFYSTCGYDYQWVKAKKVITNDLTMKTDIGDNGLVLEKTPEWKKRFIKRNRELYKKHKKEIDLWYKKYSSTLNLKVYRKFEYNCGSDYTNFRKLIIQFRQSGIRIKKPDKFPSLVAIVNTPIIWDNIIKSYRRITVKEAANLQSFKKNYAFICERNVSYKQLGNSVNVKVIRIIANQLFNLVFNDDFNK